MNLSTDRELPEGGRLLRPRLTPETRLVGPDDVDALLKRRQVGYSQGNNMTQEKTFEALNAIADEIEVAERPWLAAWARIEAPASETAGVSGAQLCEDLRLAEVALVEFISGKAKQIAEITGNSADNIRMVLVPRKEPGETLFNGLMPKFPRSAFLRQVAKHRSFNSNYWAEQERKAEREAFLLHSDPTAAVVPPDEAVAVMVAGGVPNVAPKDFVRTYGSLSPLELSMKRAGLLEQYDKAYADRVSTTKSVAFFVKGAMGDEGFVYWTKGVARQRIDIQPVERENELGSVPRG